MLDGKKSSISEIPKILSTRPLPNITGGTLSLISIRMYTHRKKKKRKKKHSLRVVVFLDKSRVFVLFGCSKIMYVSLKGQVSPIIRDIKK